MHYCPVCSLELRKVSTPDLNFCPRCGARLKSDFDRKTIPLDSPSSAGTVAALAAALSEDGLRPDQKKVSPEL